jgi:hypothetical protein
MDDPFVGTITFCRIYSGILQSGTGVVNSTREKKDRILNSPPAPWMFPSKGSGGRCFLQASARPADPSPSLARRAFRCLEPG